MSVTLYNKDGIPKVFEHKVDAKEAMSTGLFFKSTPVAQAPVEKVIEPGKEAASEIDIKEPEVETPDAFSSPKRASKVSKDK